MRNSIPTGAVTYACKQNLDELTAKAIASLNRASEDLVACEEFDAFYDMALAWSTAPGYREDEVKKLAAYRVDYILTSHRQADRGLSSFVAHCIPTWLGFDMAPALPQGDAFGWGIYSSGINICVDILGLTDRVSWTGRWRRKDEYDTGVFVDVGKELGRLLPRAARP